MQFVALQLHLVHVLDYSKVSTAWIYAIKIIKVSSTYIKQTFTNLPHCIHHH